MKNLNKLIKDLKALTIDPEVIEMDLVDMYKADANDAEVVRNFIVESDGVNIPTAAKYLNKLDTSIRESICMAIAEDKGNDFLIENFGWSVK
tara:strand:- start:125 stop:400 length:276 start_codon:yes stop_codon:yes gene_type:complete